MPKRAAKGDGMIRKRSDGRWEARCTTGTDPGTGKQIQKSIYGKTQEEVRKKLRAITKDISDGSFADAGKTTVGQWIDKWYENYTLDMKETTKKAYKSNIDNHIKPGLGKIKLSLLATDHIQSFYKKLMAKGRIIQKGQKEIKSSGLSAKTVRNIHIILHTAMKQATLPPHRLLSYNPVDNAIPPRVQDKEMQIMTDDEIVAFFDTAKNHWHYALFYTTLFCGLRRGEVLGLQWKNVDEKNGSITIISQVQRENVKEGELKLYPLKNDKPRMIYPPAAVFKVLNEYKANLQGAFEHDAGEKWNNENDLVFTNTTGGILDPDAVYQSFKALLKKAGVPGIRMHDLRHTFATNAIASGVDIKTLQETLGHYDPGFTLKRYGHSTDAMKKAAASKMDGYVAALATPKEEKKADASDALQSEIDGSTLKNEK